MKEGGGGLINSHGGKGKGGREGERKGGESG